MTDIHVHNFTLYQGDSYQFEIEVSDLRDAPFPLDDWRVSLCVRPAYGKPIFPPVEAKGNKVLLKFPKELTESQSWATARYDMQIERDDNRITIMKGSIKMERDVTP